MAGIAAVDSETHVGEIMGERSAQIGEASEARGQAETALVTERSDQKSLANQRELVQHMENLVQMVRRLKDPKEGAGR